MVDDSGVFRKYATKSGTGRAIHGKIKDVRRAPFPSEPRNYWQDHHKVRETEGGVTQPERLNHLDKGSWPEHGNLD